MLGQIDCKNEQIDLLRLDLMPAFLNRATIEITCDSSNMKLDLKIYELSVSVKERSNQKLEIPRMLYEGFKSKILPLEIQSMKSIPNPNLNDGLTAEITFIDRYGAFNRFEMRIPMEKGRNLYLIKAIIALAENLQIGAEQRNYLKKVREWYLEY